MFSKKRKLNECTSHDHSSEPSSVSRKSNDGCLRIPVDVFDTGMDELLKLLATDKLEDKHLRQFAQSMHGYCNNSDCSAVSKRELIDSIENDELIEFVSKAELVCTFESIASLEPKCRTDIAIYDTHIALLPNAKAKKGGNEIWQRESMVIKWSSIVTCVSVFADNMQAYFYLALSEPSIVRFKKSLNRIQYVLLRFEDESGIADPFEVTVQSTVNGKVSEVISAPTTVQALCQVIKALVPESVICLQSDPKLFVLPKECLKTVGGGHASGEPVYCLPVFSGASDVKVFPLRAGLFFVGPKRLTGLLNVGDITHVSYPRGVDDSMRYYEMVIHTSLKRIVKQNDTKTNDHQKSVTYSLNMIPTAAHHTLEFTLKKLGISIGEPKKTSESTSSSNTINHRNLQSKSDDNKSNEFMFDDINSEDDSDYDPEKEDVEESEHSMSDDNSEDYSSNHNSDDQKTSSIDKEGSSDS